MAFLQANLPYIQVVLAVLLTAGILMQQSDASLGAAFGGGGDYGSTERTRRGFEKHVFNTTIILATLFALSTFIALLI